MMVRWSRREDQQVGDLGPRRGDHVGAAGQVERHVQVGRSVTVNQSPRSC